MSIEHRNHIKVCHTREEEDLWTNVQHQQERREQGGEVDEGLAGAISLLLQDIAVDYDDLVIRHHMTQEFWMMLMLVKFHARVDRGIKEELLKTLAGQAYDLLQLWEDQILTNEFRISLWDGELPPLPKEVKAARETAEEPKDEPLLPATTEALLAPRGLRRGLCSGWPVSNIYVYRQELPRASSSSSGSDVGDSQSGGEVAAVDLHPHGRSSTKGRCGRKMVFST